jgi:hypothetical protein
LLRRTLIIPGPVFGGHLIWNRQTVLGLLLEYGLNGVHRATAAGFEEFGSFFLIYSRALQGIVTLGEIEPYSRKWSNANIDPERRLLLAAIESDVLAQQCLHHDLVYEATQFHLARLRLLCEFTYGDAATPLHEVWDGAAAQLHTICAGYIARVRKAWVGEKDLLKTWFGDLHMNAYPVQCVRIVEIASLACFMAADQQSREQFVSFVAEFVQAEPGCARPISDRYTVSVVLAILLLLNARRGDVASTLLERTTIWLCDRYEDRAGLAGVEADEYVETNVLLGHAFEFIDVQHRPDSFLATALMDMAAFYGDSKFYEDIVNDIKAVRIYPQYWQAQDTVGAVRVEGNDVLQYPNVVFADVLRAESPAYAEHVTVESNQFRFVEIYGSSAAVVIMALLRDRYFPKLFPLLAPNHDPLTLDSC